MELKCIRYGAQLLDFQWSRFPFDFDAFRASWYGERLRFFLNQVKMEPALDSFIHGISHTERVAFLVAVMAWQEKIDEEKTDVLLIAGLYHDIGRTDDSHDPEHGTKSVEVLRKREDILSPLSEENRNLLFAIIEAHCKNPLGTVKKYGYYTPDGFPAFLRYRAMLVDADVLDRIRLSNREKLWLSTDAAKQMEAFAAEVFSKYWRPKQGEIYYHITEETRLPSILRDGLIKPERGSLFFAETPEDCLQLAPICGSMWALKVKIEALLRTHSTTAPIIEKAYNVPLLTVDLNGYTQELFRRLNARAEDLLRYRKRVAVYEYLLDRSIPPERILNVESAAFTITMPEDCESYMDSLLTKA